MDDSFDSGAEDLTSRVHKTQMGVRLVIIDYAGLSTSPEDIQRFLRTYKL
ncbi:hypothetical protein BC943DRAFT_361004 [Umbelopsis sp. AD052]|nr:hypothetical protein BC943DRAFT_361004 [Umbelopsis sp. AD052]